MKDTVKLTKMASQKMVFDVRLIASFRATGNISSISSHKVLNFALPVLRGRLM